MLRSADPGSLRGDLLAVLQEMRGHLAPEFLAMMSGLVHAMRADPEPGREPAVHVRAGLGIGRARRPGR